MLKTRIFKIFVLVVLIVGTVTVFSGCTNNQATTKLRVPSFVNVQKDENRTLLITDDNVLAESYIFGISENPHALDLSLDRFLTYTSINPFLDVTSIFTMPKTYYYFVMAVGNNTTHLNSDATSVFCYNNQYVLGTPSLTIDGTNISWGEINNATDYSVYCNDVFVTKTSNTFYNFSSLISQAIPYTFTIVANGTGYYTNSNFSPSVTFKTHLQLSTPTNLSISNLVLRWSEVLNASTYKVLINGNAVNSSTNSLDVSSYVTDVGAYTFQVKSNSYDNYLESNYSTSLTYSKYQQLETPTGAYARINAQSVEFFWQPVANSASYSLMLNGQILISNIYTNAIVVSFEQLGVEGYSSLRRASISIKANAIGYYLESNSSSFSFIYDIFPIYLIDIDLIDFYIFWTPVYQNETYMIEIDGEEYDFSILHDFGVTSFYFKDYYFSYGTHRVKIKAYLNEDVFLYSSEFDVSLENS